VTIEAASGVTRPHRPAPWNDPRIRGIFYQILFVAVIAARGAFLIHNTLVNLRRQNSASGFGFLDREAAFGIGESLIAYSPADTYARAFLVGLVNTVVFTHVPSDVVVLLVLAGRNVRGGGIQGFGLLRVLRRRILLGRGLRLGARLRWPGSRRRGLPGLGHDQSHGGGEHERGGGEAHTLVVLVRLQLALERGELRHTPDSSAAITRLLRLATVRGRELAGAPPAGRLARWRNVARAGDTGP